MSLASTYSSHVNITQGAIMSSEAIYCTYLVTYSGDKLPPFYIGSTSKEKIAKGYFGSVSSKKWKDIYKEELSKFPEKFKIQILETFSSRKDALEAELKLHIENNVVKSDQFINEALATVNGFFGMSVRGKDNHRYGKKHTPEVQKIISEKISKTWRKNKSIWMHNEYGVNARIKQEMINEAYAQGYVKGYAPGTANVNRKGIKLKSWKGKSKVINNGVITKKIPVDAEVPEGWAIGGIKGRKHKPRVDTEPTIVITDGISTRRIKISEQIPDGWRRGRHYSPNKK